MTNMDCVTAYQEQWATGNGQGAGSREQGTNTHTQAQARRINERRTTRLLEQARGGLGGSMEEVTAANSRSKVQRCLIDEEKRGESGKQS